MAAQISHQQAASLVDHGRISENTALAIQAAAKLPAPTSPVPNLEGGVCRGQLGVIDAES